MAAPIIFAYHRATGEVVTLNEYTASAVRHELGKFGDSWIAVRAVSHDDARYIAEQLKAVPEYAHAFVKAEEVVALFKSWGVAS